MVEKARVSHALVARDLAGEVGDLRVLTLEDLPARGRFEPVETAADDVAIIAFTSGTTGTPKGCVHFHRDLLASCDTFAREILRPRPEDVFSGTPPLAFTFGLGAAVLFPMRFGASMAPVARPGDLLDVVRRHGTTTLFTAPTAYRALLQRGHPHVAAYVRLRRRTVARRGLGRLVREDRHPDRRRHRLDRDAAHLHRLAGARGAARIVRAAGARLRGADRRRGHVDAGRGGGRKLAVRGPTGCRYLDDPRQADYVRDGWNLTGDAFTMDADGYFWFQARTDDMIISSGYNISGFEVEAALLEHPLVAECAVVAAPDEERGHVVKAFVVALEDVDARVLQDHVKARIAPYKYPRRIEFVDALPRTPTGKVQRNVLREGDA